ncbi:MAG: hypothetical protein ACTSRI_00565 [Promethearchaeota archaeon]
MVAIKELKNELSEMRKSTDKLTAELHETNIAIRESFKLSSDSIQEMTRSFTKALKDALEKIADMKIQMDIKDTVLQSLGIDGIIPDFLKKKRT